MTTPEFEPAEVLFAGLPNTGKTTYLALLYLAIIESQATGISLGTYKDDREYLNRISSQLQRCLPADHTEVAEQQELRLSLLIGSEQRPLLLRIPDTSGETWEVAVTERYLSQDLDARARAASAVMLFVHPKEHFDSGTTIVAANAADAAISGTEPVPVVGQTRLHRSPTQVELVDLLQILCEVRGPRPARACIVISAYDLVNPPMAPEEWLRLNLPLLAQYIDVNRQWLDFGVFGISAQGGAFDNNSVRHLREQDALSRAIILNADGSPGGPDAPIGWILGIHG